MTTATNQFVVGQWVKVKSAAEILKTLDENGLTAGIPMMPEMLSLCGKSFRVRPANKTCVNSSTVYIGELSNVYILQTEARCDGSGHGGCQMGCNFYWHVDWLLPSEKPSAAQTIVEVDESAREHLLSLAGTGSPNCFRCQATELVNIATPSSPLKLKQYLRDLRAGVGPLAIAGFLGRLVYKKITRKSDSLVGQCKRTPSIDLNLQVGDRVQPKSVAAIQKTLDRQGCNRGLWFDPDEMAPFCGKAMVVSRVVHQLIDEKTGELKTLQQPCIVLADTACSGVFRRFCSRGMLHFWREVWLERLEA